MPWILATPEQKAVSVAARRDIAKLRLDSFAIDRKTLGVTITWREFWFDGATEVDASQFTDIVDGQKHIDVFNQPTRTTSRIDELDDIMFALLEAEGLISPGTWSPT